MQKQYNSNSSTRNTSKKHKHQKLYKMRGCNKSARKRAGHLGGSNIATMFTTSPKAVSADFNLAYPYKGPILQNTAFAYTGKGGYGKGITNSNPNGANPLYPNTGPPIGGFNFPNPLTQQRGGGCGCGGMPFMGGGGGGSHRKDCKCSSCKENEAHTTPRTSLMNGGGGCTTGNNGIPYVNGLVGKPYENPSNLPGVNGVPGGANFYSNNTYNNDVSRQMVNVGANPPFLGFKGGKRSKRKHNSKKKTSKQRGGFLANDLINLGRQFGNGMGNALNALNGYPTSPSPLPWKDQLRSKY
jgi:hypothetical protein